MILAGRLAYLFITALLIGSGYLLFQFEDRPPSIFSRTVPYRLGLSLLLLGMTYLALVPLIRKRLVFWPLVFGAASFALAFVLMSPYFCNLSNPLQCSSFVGYRFRPGPPTLEPALVAGTLSGLIGAAIAFGICSARTATIKGTLGDRFGVLLQDPRPVLPLPRM